MLAHWLTKSYPKVVKRTSGMIILMTLLPCCPTKNLWCETVRSVLFRNGTKLFVGRIFISPKFLGKGFGKLLMQEIENYFSDVDKFVLDTPVWNVRTNRFYPKCGYMETGRDEESVFYEKINGKKV